MAGRGKTPDEWAGDASRFTKHLQTGQRKAIGRASMTAKTVIVASAGRAIGSDLRMSGVGKRGAKLGVSFNVTGAANPQGLVRATGPWPLIENDTKPRRIPRVRGARARRRVLNIPGVGYRASANHPGTRGKRPWAKAMPTVAKVVPQVWRSETTAALKKSFHL